MMIKMGKAGMVFIPFIASPLEIKSLMGKCVNVRFTNICRGGRYYGNGKFLLRVFITVYYGLLRILRSFIADITGLFLRILLTLNQDPKKSPRNPNV
jgi:hypothetical protein